MRDLIKTEVQMMRVGELETPEEKNNHLGQLLSNNVLSFEKDRENLEEGFNDLSSIQMLFATTEYLTSKNESVREQALDKIDTLSGDNSSRQVLINELKKGKYSDKYSQIEKIFDKGIVQDSELADLMTHYALNAYQWGMAPEDNIRERLIGISQSHPERSIDIDTRLSAHDEIVSKNRELSLGQKIKKNWFAPLVGFGLKGDERGNDQTSRWAALTGNTFDGVGMSEASFLHILRKTGSEMQLWEVGALKDKNKIIAVNWSRAANPFQLLNFGLKAVELGVQRLTQSAFGWNKVVRGIVQAPFVLVTRVPQAIINIPAQLISLPLEKLSDYRSEKKAELEALGDLKSSSATDIDLAIESINSLLETPGMADALSAESESPRLGSDSDTESLGSPRSGDEFDEEAPLLREGASAASVDSSAVQGAEDAASLGLLNRVGNRMKKAWTDITGRFQNRTQALEEDDNLIVSELGSEELDDLSESDDTYDATVLNPEDLAEVGERLSDAQSDNSMPSAGEAIAEVSDDFMRSDGEPIPELFRDSDFESAENVVREPDKVTLVGFMAEGKSAQTLESLGKWVAENEQLLGPGETQAEEKITSYQGGQSIQQVGDDIELKGFSHEDSRRLIGKIVEDEKARVAAEKARIQAEKTQQGSDMEASAAVSSSVDLSTGSAGEKAERVSEGTKAAGTSKAAMDARSEAVRARSDTGLPVLDPSLLQPMDENTEEQTLGSATAEAESDALTEKFSIAKMFSNIKLRFTGKKAEAAPSETLPESEPVVVAKPTEVETAVAETEKTGGAVVKAEYNEVRLIGFAEVLESENAQSKAQSKLQGWVDKMEETLGKPAGKVGEYPIEFQGGQRVEVRGKDLVLRGFSEDDYLKFKNLRLIDLESQKYTISGADAASYQRAADGMGGDDKKDLSSRLSSARLFLEQSLDRISTGVKGLLAQIGLRSAEKATPEMTSTTTAKDRPSEIPRSNRESDLSLNESEALRATSGKTTVSTTSSTLRAEPQSKPDLKVEAPNAPKVPKVTAAPSSPKPKTKIKGPRRFLKVRGIISKTRRKRSDGPPFSLLRVKFKLADGANSQALREACEQFAQNEGLELSYQESENAHSFKAVLKDPKGGTIAVTSQNSGEQVTVQGSCSSAASSQTMAKLVGQLLPDEKRVDEISGPEKKQQEFNEHFKAVQQSSEKTGSPAPMVQSNSD